MLGAGLPRTGTKSLRVALTELLGGPCYHMFSVFESNDDSDFEFWSRAVRRNVNSKVTLSPNYIFISAIYQ